MAILGPWCFQHPIQENSDKKRKRKLCFVGHEENFRGMSESKNHVINFMSFHNNFLSAMKCRGFGIKEPLSEIDLR